MARLPKGKAVLPLPPFKAWLASNIPAVYDNTMTYYEELCALIKYLQSVVLPALNENAAAVTVISNAVEQLQKYVDDYFKNLDVQEEINNKLDEMTESGELEEIIGEWIKDKVKYIFPKFWANAGSGDCNLIQTPHNNILIDCYTSDMWTNVKQMLDDKSVSHVDYFILTHYDVDHYGNLQNLITNNYIDSETVVLLSANVATYGAAYSSRINEVHTLLTNSNIEYRTPDEGEIITIDSLKLEFRNCDANIIDSYAVKDGNSCSLVILTEHRGVKSLYTGDATSTVQARLRSIDFPNSNVSLYKIAHHGINIGTDWEFVRRAFPVYAVQTSGIVDATTNQYGIGGEAAVLRNLGSKVYSTHMQKDYLEFESDGSSMQCVNGLTLNASAQSAKINYYVDINASKNAVQDGSQEHPFTQIMQALAAIPYNFVGEVGIDLADGYYGNYGLNPNNTLENDKNRVMIGGGKSTKITIRGNENDRTAVTLKGLWVQYSNVVLKNLTVDLSIWDGITAYDSYIEVDNVLVSDVTEVAETPKSGILLRQNSIMAVTGSGLRVEKCSNCIRIQSGSSFLAGASVSIGSHSANVIDTLNPGQIVASPFRFTFDTASDAYSCDFYIQSKTPASVMQSHATNATTVNTTVSFADVEWVEVFYKSTDGYYGSTGRIYNPNNHGACLYLPKFGSDVISNKQGKIQFSGTTIEITNQYAFKFNPSTSTTTAESGTFFNIEKVIVGYKDWVDLN